MALVRYVVEDGELVSVAWKRVIDELKRRGVDPQVNEGKRSLERQRYFYNCYLCQCCNNGNLAARPNPWAPHIRVGFANHALDLGNPDDVVRELRELGIDATTPVDGEPWHVEVPLWQLLRVARRLKKKSNPYDTLPIHVRRAVKQFIGARNTVRDRIKDRDRIDSKWQPKKWVERDREVIKARRVRAKRRKRLERMLARATSAKTKRILRKVLDT